VTPERGLLVNFERMWREMDELLGPPPGQRFSRTSRAQGGFSPRVDVYYCGDDRPRAIVKVELAGVDPGSIGLEIAGRELIIAGERPVQETEGRVYQQLEIEAGAFRRAVELGGDVAPEEARATYEDGILRVELPLRRADPTAHRVPIDTPDE
jgi:HSP20 family protein